MIRLFIFGLFVLLLIELIKSSRQNIGRKKPRAGSSPLFNYDPYHVLGVDKAATPEEIRQAYHQRCRENHPDQVAHLSEEIQETAKNEMQKINWAYQKLEHKQA